MIAAEELDMDFSQLKSIDPDTNVTQNKGVGSSSGIRVVGPQVRAAAAYAKQALLGLAASQLGVSVTSLTVAKGVVSGGGRSLSYGELIGDKLFNVKMTSPTLQAGQAPAKAVSQYKLIGTRVPRIDIPAKVTGAFTYASNIRVPGMWHGRIVRPRGQGAYGTGAQILSIDKSSIKHLPNVQLVRKGDFLGVVAPAEYDAIQAAAQLKVKWADPPALLAGNGNEFGRMRELDSAGKSIQTYIQDSGNVDARFASAAKVLSQSYTYAYQGHDPLGPKCVVVDVTPDGAVVYCFAQGVYAVRTGVAKILGLPENKVRVIFAGGSSQFSGDFSDPAEAAAVMSQVVGKPVRVQEMRWDNHGWDSHGQAMITDIEAAIDANGNMLAFKHTAFTWQNAAVAPTLALSGVDSDYAGKARTAYEGMMGPASDGTGNRGVDGRYGADPQYPGVGNRILVKALPAALGQLPVSSVEGPGHPQNLFAAEQMVDELAYAAKMDPLEFRLQNIRQMPWAKTAPPSPLITIGGVSVPTSVALGGQTTPDRLRVVLNKIAEISNWQPKVAASNLSKATVVNGRGVAFQSHAPDAFGAVVVDIEVNKKTGKIVVKHAYGVQDSGLAINPELIEPLMSGGLVHGVSRALLEEVKYNKTNVTSLDWATYPILRFNDSPNTTTVALTNPNLLPKGGGEEVHVQVPAAVANAFFDATGVRIRQAPMTPGRVRAVLKAAGVA
jgi:CO/xanthine dehydrogenase Mo-binding subunit